MFVSDVCWGGAEALNHFLASERAASQRQQNNVTIVSQIAVLPPNRTLVLVCLARSNRSKWLAALAYGVWIVGAIQTAPVLNARIEVGALWLLLCLRLPGG